MRRYSNFLDRARMFIALIVPKCFAPRSHVKFCYWPAIRQKYFASRPGDIGLDHLRRIDDAIKLFCRDIPELQRRLL
jgi:hypothetical protein